MPDGMTALSLQGADAFFLVFLPLTFRGSGVSALSVSLSPPPLLLCPLLCVLRCVFALVFVSLSLSLSVCFGAAPRLDCLIVLFPKMGFCVLVGVHALRYTKVTIGAKNPAHPKSLPG